MNSSLTEILNEILSILEIMNLTNSSVSNRIEIEKRIKLLSSKIGVEN